MKNYRIKKINSTKSEHTSACSLIVVYLRNLKFFLGISLFFLLLHAPCIASFNLPIAQGSINENTSQDTSESLELLSTEIPKKYTLSVCAIFKNEAPYLKEWIAYHRVVGVDHFYLYNNGSIDYYADVLAPYIHENLVTLIDWTNFSESKEEDKVFIWSLSTQVSAYENAIYMRAGHETKWLVFLDISEFLVPNFANKITDLIEQYDDRPGIIISSDCFNAFNRDFTSQRKLLIETLTLTEFPQESLQKQITKTIFKPELCLSFHWPPYHCVFKGNLHPVALKRDTLRINRYINRHWDFENFFKKRKSKLHIDNRLLSSEETSELLKNGYEIEDQEHVIGRFIPNVLYKLNTNQGG